MNMTLRVILLLLCATSPLFAQRAGRGGPPPPDTTAMRTAPDGLVMDFVNQDVSVVLRAIAEVAGLNITLSSMPAARVSLRLQQQLTRDEAIDALRAVAEGSDITVTEGETVIRLVGPPPTPAPTRLSAAQQLAQARENRLLNLYTVRLKHSSATSIAPMLMNLLTGSGSSGVSVSNGRANVTLGAIQNVQRGGARGGNNNAPGAPVEAANAGVAIREALGQAFGNFGQNQSSALAFSDIRIVPDELTNSLIIRATEEDFQAVQQLVQTVDLRPLQVLIEVTIAQVERNSDLNLGVSGNATRTSGDTSAVLPGAGTARDFVFMLTGGKGSVNYDLAINALQTRGDVKVLALPILIAQNNREAVLNVGSNVPFVQVTQAGGFDPNARVQTIQYRPVGKQLTITPTINTDGYVNMEVTQTNDDVTNNLLFDAPIINQRQAQTAVFVRDGQTTVIGGLSDNTSEESTSGIPFLSRLPLLGWLFGNTRTSNRSTELFLFLTPHIVSSDEDIDRLRESLRSGSQLLQGVNIEGRISPAGDTINIGVPDTSRVRPAPPDTL